MECITIYDQNKVRSRTHEHSNWTLSLYMKRVQCIECVHLFIRKEDVTTYFCLKHRDYLTEIDEDIECPDFKKQEKHHSY